MDRFRNQGRDMDVRVSATRRHATLVLTCMLLSVQHHLAFGFDSCKCPFPAKESALADTAPAVPDEYILRLSAGFADAVLRRAQLLDVPTGVIRTFGDPGALVVNARAFKSYVESQPGTSTWAHGQKLIEPAIVAIEPALKAFVADAQATIGCIERNLLFRLTRKPGDQEYRDGHQWGLDDIGAPAAWDRTTGDDTIVAVIDSGIDMTHEDLAPYEPANFTVSECPGHPGPVADYPCDELDHGTGVASIIAARTDNDGLGLAGVAWHARLMPIKFADEDRFDCTVHGCAPLDRASLAIRHAVDHHARILNLSWGADVCTASLHAALKYARDHRVLVVAAVDNASSDLGAVPFYPASDPLDNVVAVGASNRCESVYPPSDIGSRVLFAPGAEITVASTDGSYGSAAGASVAAPHVSGAAVLVLSLAHDWQPRQVRQYLVDSADRLEDRSTGYRFRRLNIDRATSAPILFSTDLTNTGWRRGTARVVRWAERFRSRVCSRGDFVLVSAAPAFEAVVGNARWRARHARITVPANLPPSREVRLEGRCRGTLIAAQSDVFTLE